MSRHKINQASVLDRCVSDCEIAVILHVLLKTKGNLCRAARLLGIETESLIEKINKYGIDYAQFGC